MIIIEPPKNKKISFLKPIGCITLLIFICFICPLPSNIACNVVRLIIISIGLMDVIKNSKEDIQDETDDFLEKTFTIDEETYELESKYSEIIDIVENCKDNFLKYLKNVDDSMIVENFNNDFIKNYHENISIIKNYDVDIYHKASCLCTALLQAVGSFFIYSSKNSDIYTYNYNVNFAIYVAMYMTGFYKDSNIESILPYFSYLNSILDACSRGEPEIGSEKQLHCLAINLKKLHDLNLN